MWEHQSTHITEVRTETRWPRFIQAVRDQTPVRSALSIQLYTTDTELGALNLYSEQSDAFGPVSEDLATNLATHAAIALSAARRGDQFRSALATRDVIGQAKGICMERFGIDAGAAFNLLRQLSQETNTSLAELAEQLVATDHAAPEAF